MENQENQGLIAISNCLARAKDGMTMQEKKLCAIYLSKLEWKKQKNNREIWIDKSDIMKMLDSKIDYDDQSVYLRRLAQGMVHHSELHFDGADKNEWEDMPLFTRRKSTRGQLMIELYDGAMKLLEGLKCEYITLFLADILRFDSNIDGLRAYKLYEYLRLNSDTRRINTHLLSTRQIKELFDIPEKGKGSYMREKSGFDRGNFEKRVIDPVLTMLSECEHVVLHNYGFDKSGNPILYKKIKKGAFIKGYEVTYSINKYSHKIKRETIFDVQAKPETLKVAQDILDSKKKSKKNTSYSSSGRVYSAEEMDTLEEKLLNT